MDDNRIGIFYLDSNYVDECGDKVVEFLKEIEFLPLRVEYQMDRHSFMYVGHSPKFKEKVRHAMAPEYVITEKWIEVEHGRELDGFEFE